MVAFLVIFVLQNAADTGNLLRDQGAKKVSFTACHWGKL